MPEPEDSLGFGHCRTLTILQGSGGNAGRRYATKRDKYPKPELDDDEQVDSDVEEESESESD